MIMRLWRGRVPAASARAYVGYQSEVGPPGYRVIPGNRGILMLGQEHGDQYEVAMLTLWDSLAAVRAFAGEPIDAARYYERDFDFLIDPPEKVDHFDVVEARAVRRGAGFVRLWRGAAHGSRADDALRFESDTGIPAYLDSAGNRGVLLVARDAGARLEIGMVTLWDSLGSIAAFSGDPHRACYDAYRRAGLDYLVELPQRVDVFRILEAERLESSPR